MTHENRAAVQVHLSTTARRLATQRSWNLLELNQLISFLHGQEILQTAASKALEHIEEALQGQQEDPTLVFGAIEYFRRKLRRSVGTSNSSHTVELRIPGDCAQKLSIQAYDLDLLLPPVATGATPRDYLSQLNRARAHIEDRKQEHALLRMEVEELLSALGKQREKRDIDFITQLSTSIANSNNEASEAHVLDARRCYKLCEGDADAAPAQSARKHRQSHSSSKTAISDRDLHLRLVH